MKKIYILLIAIACSLFTNAQVIDSNKMETNENKVYSLLPPFVIDLNFLGGILTQNLVTVNTASNYLNAVNANISNPKLYNGSTFGGDIQLGFFFGKRRNFGIGSGINYLIQQGNTVLDSFHIEYQSTDSTGNIFRQLLTSNQAVNETIKTTNINIPLVFKYKTKFTNRVGFTLDAGLMFNLQLKNVYKTNASFDYEAIYTNPSNYYDNSVVPLNTDIIITRNQLLKSVSESSLQSIFDNWRSVGDNVGLGIKPLNNSGTITYLSGSVGFIIRPALSLQIYRKLALNIGGFILYQPFKNNAENNYKLTDKIGQYSSILNSISSGSSQTLGFNIGLRYFFGKLKDKDKDGIPDAHDECPTVFGIEKFHGCPDTDGDGIEDRYDSCPNVKGLIKFHGCPDTDGDGIIDKNDSCPKIFGLPQFNGCPDTDGDGIPDKDDGCPFLFGPKENNGCPYQATNQVITDTLQVVTKPKKRKSSAIKHTNAKKYPTRYVMRNGKRELVHYKIKYVTKHGKRKEIFIEIPDDGPITDTLKPTTDTLVQKIDNKHKVKTKKTVNKKKNSEENNIQLVTKDTTYKEEPDSIISKENIAKLTGLTENLVRFEPNKAVILKSSYIILDKDIEILNNIPSAVFSIDGFADNSGKPAANKRLSRARAESVKKYLILKGIEPQRLFTKGHGSAHPIASNNTPQGRAKNRRVVLRLMFNLDIE